MSLRKPFLTAFLLVLPLLLPAQTRTIRMEMDWLHAVRGIHDLGYRAAFDYRPSPHHHIRFGTDYTWHSFRPQSRHDESFSSDDARVDTTSLVSRNSHYANEWNVYAEDEMRFNDHWSVNTGLNASLFHINGWTFSSADPRLAVKYQVCRQLSLKASAAIMSQYVHKIDNPQTTICL